MFENLLIFLNFINRIIYQMKKTALFIFVPLCCALTAFSQPDTSKSPAPVTASTPAPVIESTPAPVIESTPAPVIESTPAPVAASIPAPVAASIPAPEVANTRSSLSKLNISIGGNGSIMFGRIVSGYEFGTGKEHKMADRWQNAFSGRIELKSQPKDWYYTSIGLEIASYFPVTMASAIQKESFKLAFKSAVPRAVGVFDFKFDAWSFLIESGMMEYNFNPEIKNLGNFMYRSSAYPFCLKTRVDYPYANLMGIRPEVKFLNDQVKIEVVVNSILDQYPFFDFSGAVMAYYRAPNNLFDLGIGYCKDRAFAVDKALTDCNDIKSKFTDSTLTFRSRKVDARLILDFKPLFGNPSVFGKNDFKIYGEAAIIGLKNPKYFADETITPSIINRMPFLVGINFPTCKILDLFSLELEYCKNPYANNWWGGQDGFPSPEPRDVSEEDSTWNDNYKNKDNLKWTLYFKKSFSNFNIIAFFANDHTFYETRNSENQAYVEQTLRTNKDWHWYLKLQYNL
jgi:hypothetical protein